MESKKQGGVESQKEEVKRTHLHTIGVLGVGFAAELVQQQHIAGQPLHWGYQKGRNGLQVALLAPLCRCDEAVHCRLRLAHLVQHHHRFVELNDVAFVRLAISRPRGKKVLLGYILERKRGC